MKKKVMIVLLFLFVGFSFVYANDYVAKNIVGEWNIVASYYDEKGSVNFYPGGLAVFSIVGEDIEQYFYVLERGTNTIYWLDEEAEEYEERAYFSPDGKLLFLEEEGMVLRKK